MKITKGLKKASIVALISMSVFSLDFNKEAVAASFSFNGKVIKVDSDGNKISDLSGVLVTGQFENVASDGSTISFRGGSDTTDKNGDFNLKTTRDGEFLNVALNIITVKGTRETFVLENRGLGRTFEGNGTIQVEHPSEPNMEAIPEPITILGSFLALGFGSFFKRAYT